MNNSPKIIIKIVLVILLGLCLAKMPYGYFQLVRFFAMVVFFWLFLLSGKSNLGWAVIWFFSALLINPFIKVALGRDIWNILDVVWMLLLLFSISIDFSDIRKALRK